MNCLCSCNDFLVSGIELTVGNVFTNRSGKEEVVLRHNTHLLAETFDAYGFYVMSINFNRALLNVIEAADEVDNGSFSRTGRTYQSNGFAQINMEADIL